MSIDKRADMRLSQWLDKMEAESWQLELILSGFVIFLLLLGLEPFHSLWPKIDQLSDNSNYFAFLEGPYHIFRIAYYILIVAIIFHVFLRGLWISTIGLRSVSGDIEWEEFNMSPKFDNYLKKQIPSFDHYIKQLDRYCSISFAYTFLLVFSILAAGSFLMGLIIVQFATRSIIDVPLFSGDQVTKGDDIVMMIYMILGVIYLVDFLTMGWLKKFEWFSKFYYPVYRFFGWITFANFYRPIYYNLVDNKLGRRLAMMILPISILIVTLMSLKYYGNAYMSSDPLQSSQHWYLDDAYEDMAKENVTKQRVSIHAQTIKENYLRLFVPYLSSAHEPTIRHLCSELEPAYFTGIKLRGGISAGDIINSEADTKDLLSCVKKLWRVMIDDSLYVDANFRFYHHPLREQDGLLAIIPIHHLDQSEHFIKVDRQRYINDELKWYDGRYLWFYKD